MIDIERLKERITSIGCSIDEIVTKLNNLSIIKDFDQAEQILEDLSIVSKQYKLLVDLVPEEHVTDKFNNEVHQRCDRIEFCISSKMEVVDKLLKERRVSEQNEYIQ
jgi:hypothetical protein